MPTSPTVFAQAAFDLLHACRKNSVQGSRSVKLLARVAKKFVEPVAKKIGFQRNVVAEVYGRRMVMPSEHPLPEILCIVPQYNRPLALAVEAIHKVTGNSGLSVVDIGANIGDTAAVIEQRTPGICRYLCIEPDSNMAAICAENLAGLPVEVRQNFIGDQEGTTVRLQNDGRANPSTMIVDEGTQREENATEGQLVSLDQAALSFTAAHGLSLIKVDTEGYDFAVLRSGGKLLQQFHPGIFLEWYPSLLLALHEDPCAGFDYLRSLGYSEFVFFTNHGDFYCRISNPDALFLKSLAAVTLQQHVLPYFDVFASTSSAICDELTTLTIAG